MKDVAKLSNAEREELFLVTAREKALPEAVIEKDFWVCWTLNYLFHESPWKEHTRYTAATTRPRLTTMCAPRAKRRSWRNTSARTPTQSRHRADLARATFLRLDFGPQERPHNNNEYSTHRRSAKAGRYFFDWRHGKYDNFVPSSPAAP